MDIKGITAIVTGGASGLGRATVAGLRERGANIGVLDLTKTIPQDYVDDPNVLYVPTDVTDEAQVIDALARIAAHFGSIDACVNCAGIFYSAPVMGENGVHTQAAFNNLMNINVNGTFTVLSRAVEHMVRNDGRGSDKERGVLVNISSARAFDGGAGGMAYAASKGAILSMTLSLARDLAQHRIRSNSIAPGLMNTEMFHNLTAEAIASHTEKVEFPKRLGDPAEFANAVCFLIENKYMNGETLRIDAGMRV